MNGRANLRRTLRMILWLAIAALVGTLIYFIVTGSPDIHAVHKAVSLVRA